MAKVYTDALEGRYFDQVKAKRILFAQMAEKYLDKYEKLRDRTSLKRLMPVFGQLTLAEITTERISDYHKDRLKAVKPATVYQELALLTVSALKDGFCRAVEKAGLEDFHFHDLRHTFATRLVQNGIDLYVVKELLGHKTITMTMRYAHHYPESLTKGIEVLDKVCYNFATFGVKPGKETLASTPGFPLKLRGNTIGSV
ncbi:MAG: site-specific integrase [Nitrospiraceae bacterium]|nr:site-specific integrase [Nitrospiraceae bacterium]